MLTIAAPNRNSIANSLGFIVLRFAFAAVDFSSGIDCEHCQSHGSVTIFDFFRPDWPPR